MRENVSERTSVSFPLPERTLVVFLRLHTYRRFRCWFTDQFVAVVVGENLFHNRIILGRLNGQGNKKVAGSRYQRLSGVMKALRSSRVVMKVVGPEGFEPPTKAL